VVWLRNPEIRFAWYLELRPPQNKTFPRLSDVTIIFSLSRKEIVTIDSDGSQAVISISHFPEPVSQSRTNSLEEPTEAID
jgi:hypothetical protein